MGKNDPVLVGGDVRSSISLSALGRSAARDPEQAIHDALQIAREHLRMDVSYISRITATEQVIGILEGDAASFGFAPGTTIPIEETYCRRMIDGQIPNVVPDSAANELLRDLPATQESGIGAYLGVPLVLPDGEVYGSLCCISRQSDPSLNERDADLLHLVARLIGDALERERLLELNWSLRSQTVSAHALMAAVDARDGYTAEHSDAVLAYAAETARELGLGQADIDLVAQVAVLHDIGKIGIPDAILSKEGPLDDVEWAVMRTHSAIGEHIVAAVDGLSHLAPFIRGEHEHWDGSGYPDGLSGDAIPLVSRIVLVCDAYHAMVSDRPYRKAITVQAAAAELLANAGTQFDPTVVHAFLARPAIRKIMEIASRKDSVA